MITSVLDIIRASLEESLKPRFPDIAIQINKLVGLDGNPTVSSESNAVVMTLVHVKEEHVMRNGRTSDLNQPYYLSLFLLFSTYANEQNSRYDPYLKSLEYLDGVLNFFQQNTTFTSHTHSNLPHGVHHLEFRLANEELREMSYVWTMTGAKQAPSVLYMVRNAVVGQALPGSLSPTMGGFFQ